MPLPLFAFRHLLFKPLIITVLLMHLTDEMYDAVNCFLNYLWQVRRARTESSHEKARPEHHVCNLVLVSSFSGGRDIWGHYCLKDIL